MTRKRKSMSIGCDVHAISPKVRSHCEAMFAVVYNCEGYQGCCPDKSGPPWALLAGFASLGSLCSQYVQKVMKSLEKRSFIEILSCSSLR